MPAPNPLAIFAPRLNQIAVRWMAVGSVAANAYGEFRTTFDVDKVVVLADADAERLAQAFPENEFYCPPLDVIKLETARTQRGHFNLIDHETGFKADVYIATSGTAPTLGLGAAARSAGRGHHGLDRAS